MYIYSYHTWRFVGIVFPGNKIIDAEAQKYAYGAQGEHFSVK